MANTHKFLANQLTPFPPKERAIPISEKTGAKRGATFLPMLMMALANFCVAVAVC